MIKAVPVKAGERSNGMGDYEKCQQYRINNMGMDCFSVSKGTKDD